MWIRKKNIFISDVGTNNCVYVINKNMQIIGIIKNKEILTNFKSFNLNDLNLNKIYDLVVSDKDIFISSTHTNKLFQIKNIFF